MISRRFLLRTSFALAASGLALFSAGCSTNYAVKIEAFSRASAFAPDRGSYRIEDRHADGTRPLRQKEIAGHLKTALSAHGLYEAPDPRAAEIVVELDYGIGPERVEQTVYQELINGRPVPATARIGRPPEGVAREMMGYTPMVNTTVLREKFLSIRARRSSSRAGAQPPEDLWRVDVTIDDEGDDLRGRLPVLLAAAMDQIGRSTDKPAMVTLHSNDEAVRFVRKGM